MKQIIQWIIIILTIVISLFIIQKGINNIASLLESHDGKIIMKIFLWIIFAPIIIYITLIVAGISNALISIPNKNKIK